MKYTIKIKCPICKNINGFYTVEEKYSREINDETIEIDLRDFTPVCSKECAEIYDNLKLKDK